MSIQKKRTVILRDLILFNVKLALDGAKDLVLAPVSLIAAAVDMVVDDGTPGRYFYAVVRLGERFDRWLSLLDAATDADAREEGLFGASRAGSPSLLGKIEAIILGHEEPV